MTRFPITHLFDESKCYGYLMDLPHPKGFHCPCGKAIPSDQATQAACSQILGIAVKTWGKTRKKLCLRRIDNKKG